MYIYIYMYTYIHPYMYAYIYIHTHTHTHTYIHTHTHTGLAHLVGELPNASSFAAFGADAAAADARVFDLQLSLDPAAQVRP